MSVPRKDDRKPDPDEPWRHVCPECGGQVSSSKSMTSYRCCRCGLWSERDELVDLKEK